MLDSWTVPQASNFLKIYLAAYPVFMSSLPSINTAIEGVPKAVSCKVKSRPVSTLTWLHDVGVVGVATQSVTRDGYYFITTGIFTINDPLYSMTGKKIVCTGKPVFGAPIKQNTTLNVVCEFIHIFHLATARHVQLKVEK